MEKNIFEGKRNSYMEPGEIYFWTARIANWNLVTDPFDYLYSSCRYYELGIKDFEFLKDLMEEV